MKLEDIKVGDTIQYKTGDLCAAANRYCRRHNQTRLQYMGIYAYN